MLVHNNDGVLRLFSGWPLRHGRRRIHDAPGERSVSGLGPVRIGQHPIVTPVKGLHKKKKWKLDG
jgi:hypothetical protein